MKTITFKEITRPFLWLLLLGIAFTGGRAANFSYPPMALLVLAPDGRTNEFCPVVEYAKVEFESGLALKVILSDGQSTSIPKGQIVQVFKYPDPNQPLAEKRDSDELKAKRNEAIGLAARFSKAKPYLDRVVTAIDADLNKFATGQVRCRQQWMNRADYERDNATTNSSVDFPTLIVGNKTFREVQIQKLENEGVSIRHQGGVARLMISELDPEFFKKLFLRKDIMKAYRPVPEVVVNGITLHSAVLLADASDDFTILHDRGIAKVSRRKLEPPVRRSLFESNAAFQANSTSVAVGNVKKGTQKVIRSWGSFEVPSRMTLLEISQGGFGESIAFTSAGTIDPDKMYSAETLRVEVFAPNMDIEEIGRRIFSQEFVAQRKRLLSLAKNIEVGGRQLLQIPHAKLGDDRVVGGFVFIPPLDKLPEFAIHWIVPTNETVVSSQPSDVVELVCATLAMKGHSPQEVEANHLALTGVDSNERRNGLCPFRKTPDELRKLFGRLQEIRAPHVDFPGAEVDFIPEYSTPPLSQAGVVEFLFREGKDEISAFRASKKSNQPHFWLSLLESYFSDQGHWKPCGSASSGDGKRTRLNLVDTKFTPYQEVIARVPQACAKEKLTSTESESKPWTVAFYANDDAGLLACNLTSNGAQHSELIVVTIDYLEDIKAGRIKP